MNIVLFCVFNIISHPPGEVKEKLLSVDAHHYKILKYEAGHDEKLRLCRKVFHKKAALAWFHDAEG